MGYAEEDAYSKYWRKRYCYLQRAGVIKKIKRFSHKKDRAIGKKRAKEID